MSVGGGSGLALILVGVLLHVLVADAARGRGVEADEHAVGCFELHAVVLRHLLDDDVGGFLQDALDFGGAADATGLDLASQLLVGDHVVNDSLCVERVAALLIGGGSKLHHPKLIFCHVANRRLT